MRKTITGIVVSMLFLTAFGTPLYAWPWGEETVTTINGQKFTTEDVEKWWKNWQEPHTSFPDSATPFENWHLMAQEALTMELDREPSFQHKINIFLKARTLLVYRAEMIDSQINITEKELWDTYVKKYTPSLRLNIFYFNDRKQADNAHVSLTSATSEEEFAQIVEKMNSEQKGSVFYQNKIIRPTKEPTGWKPILDTMKQGDFSHVFAWSKGFVLLHLAEQLGANKEDFHTLSKSIEKDLRDREVALRTNQLVEQLKATYNVKINEEVLKAIEIDGDNSALLDQTVLTMAGYAIPVKSFLVKLNEESRFRKKFGFKAVEPEKMKRRVLNGIISQTLTSMAALDRHYEKEPPLLATYTFYRQHRLIKELEKRLFSGKMRASEEEIQSYYNENMDEFSSPEILSFAVIKDEKKLIDKISTAIKQGGDFFNVSARYYSQEVEIKRLPENKIDAGTLAILKTMVPGEVSEPQTDESMLKIIKFVKRTPGDVVPFERVKKMIEENLKKKKREKIRADFLRRLRNSSSIKTNEKAWATLQKKFGESDEISTH